MTFLCCLLPSKESLFDRFQSLTPRLLSEVPQSNSFPKITVWSLEKCNFTVEELGKGYLGQVIKVNVNGDEPR